MSYTFQTSQNTFNVKNQYLDYAGLQQKNKERAMKGRTKIGYQDFLGYLTRDSKFKNNQNRFNSIDDQVIEDAKNHGYLIRETAINKKYGKASLEHDTETEAVGYEQFRWKDTGEEEPIIAYYNQECLTESNFNEKTRDFYNQLKRESENPDSNFQMLILTFDPKDNGLLKDNLDPKSLYETLDINLKKLFEEYGYDYDNLNYCLVAHTDKDHLHVHVPFMEKVKHRRRGKLDISKNQEFKDNINTWLNARCEERDYYQLNLDKNLLDRYKYDNPLDKDLFKRICNCPSKTVGHMKDKELQQDIYKYTDEFLKNTGYQEACENNYYKRLNRIANDEAFNDKDAKDLTDKEYIKLRNATANKLYKDIKSNVNKEKNYEYNDEDIRKRPYTSNNYKYDEKDYKQTNALLEIRRMQYLMSGAKSNTYILKQIKKGFKEGVRNVEKNK